jgi:hypothetical protein
MPGNPRLIIQFLGKYMQRCVMGLRSKDPEQPAVCHSMSGIAESGQVLPFGCGDSSVFKA